MNANEVLQAMAGIGARLTVVYGDLIWRTPRQTLPDDLKSELLDHKDELLEILVCGDEGSDLGTLACWRCWTPWESRRLMVCRHCKATAPGLSEAAADTVIYGRGKWLCHQDASGQRCRGSPSSNYSFQSSNGSGADLSVTNIPTL